MELDDSALSEQDAPRNPHGVFPLPHPHPMALGRGTQGVGGQRVGKPGRGGTGSGGCSGAVGRGVAVVMTTR